jgi:hypothetical protein
MTCLLLCPDSCGRIKCSIEAVNMCGVNLLCLGVVPTTFLGIKLSCVLRNKS